MQSFPFQSLDLSSVFVVDASIAKSDYTPIDMSANNEALKKIDITDADEVEKYVTDFVANEGCKVAYGGYLEVRDLYKRSEYFNQEEDPDNERNIHLGIDVWCAVGTSVLAAVDGVVHSFKNNTNHGDYGPAIILKHELEGKVFYTLYGHLSLDSLKHKTIGMPVKQGEEIAQLGDKSVNGDYAPHLHFQIIMDVQGNEGDYPGVSSTNDLSFYKENCPDANLLLGL